MIVKDNGKGRVTRRNKQTIKYFLPNKQLNTFDHPYHMHKFLDSEPSTFLLVNRYIISNKFDKHIQLHMIKISTGAVPGPGVTRIVPTFWPRNFSDSTRIMPLPRPFESWVRWKIHPSHLCNYVLVGAISE